MRCCTITIYYSASLSSRRTTHSRGKERNFPIAELSPQPKIAPLAHLSATEREKSPRERYFLKLNYPALCHANLNLITHITVNLILNEIGCSFLVVSCIALLCKKLQRRSLSTFKTTARVHVARESGKIIQKQWCKAQE